MAAACRIIPDNLTHKRRMEREPDGWEVKRGEIQGWLITIFSPSGPYHLCHDSNDVTPRGDGTNYKQD